MRRIALALILVAPAACSAGGAGCDPVETEGDATLHLYVSNQSFETDPVAIEVYIDDEPVVCDDFVVEGQHNWIEFDLAVEPGAHLIRAVGDGGSAVIETTFHIDTEKWAVLGFWHQPPEPKEFTFSTHDEPVLFA
jgi:hypothetical protein